MESSASIDTAVTQRHEWPNRRELAAIIAFWVVYGAVSIVNRMFPPTGPGMSLSIRFVVGTGLEALIWLFATPLVFWMTQHYRAAATNRVPRLALYVAVGLALAAINVLLVEFARTVLPLPRMGPVPYVLSRQQGIIALGRGRYLGQCMIALAVFAVGIARGSAAEHRARAEESMRLRSELAEARLAMLRSQLNPHFLYNTLNSISALVDLDPRGVRRMIARLSELLRFTLEPSLDAEVPLSNELTVLERYLEILRIRFQGRLDTQLDVGPDAAGALVPPMILQPLVENAMKHAVSKTSAPSTIAIGIRRQDDALVLTVRDTGSGAGAGTGAGAGAASAAVASANGSRLGLRNTRARLREIYGDDCELTMTPLPEGGMEAAIRLPYHTADDLRAAPAAD
jgi:signal transduction histidine kinase